MDEAVTWLIVIAALNVIRLGLAINQNFIVHRGRRLDIAERDRWKGIMDKLDEVVDN